MSDLQSTVATKLAELAEAQQTVERLRGELRQAFDELKQALPRTRQPRAPKATPAKRGRPRKAKVAAEFSEPDSRE